MISNGLRISFLILSSIISSLHPQTYLLNVSSSASLQQGINTNVPSFILPTSHLPMLALNIAAYICHAAVLPHVCCEAKHFITHFKICKNGGGGLSIGEDPWTKAAVCLAPQTHIAA